MPTRIVCVRHAEEPAEAIDQWGPGYNEFGHCSDNGLSIRGWQRAGALAATALCGLVPSDELDKTLHIFVPHYDGEPDHHRASLTIAPFARRIGAQLRTRRNKDQVVPGLCEDVLAVQRTAVVCWQHQNLAILVDKLFNDRDPPVKGERRDDETGERLQWPTGRFDIIWVLSSSTGHPPYRLDEHLQCLLPGDEGSSRFIRDPPVAPS